MKMIKLSEDHYIVMDDSEITTGDIVAEKLLTGKYELFTIHTLNDIDEQTQKKVICSTQPLELICCTPVGQIKRYIDCKGCDRVTLGYNEVKPLFLSEVKELLGVVNVEKKAFELAILFHNTYEKLAPAFGYETRLDTKVFDKNSANGKLMIAVCKEIYQALEDNKEKKYTEKDIDKAYWAGMQFVGEDKGSFGEFIQSLQPTEWEVEMVNGKLKLKP